MGMRFYWLSYLQVTSTLAFESGMIIRLTYFLCILDSSVVETALSLMGFAWVVCPFSRKKGGTTHAASICGTLVQHLTKCITCSPTVAVVAC